MGRPSDKTSELLAQICERLAAGESVRAICKGEEMPSAGTVFRWLVTDDAFREQYARAKEAGCLVVAEELLEIADEDPGDLLTGGKDSAAIAHQRLRVDTRKWYLSKIVPKIYGDKISTEHSGTIDLAERILRARKRVGH